MIKIAVVSHIGGGEFDYVNKIIEFETEKERKAFDFGLSHVDLYAGNMSTWTKKEVKYYGQGRLKPHILKELKEKL